MTIEDAREILSANGVRTDTYSLEGGSPEEKLCLEKHGDIWEVYYSERGERNDLKAFASENEACVYLVQLLLGDPTVRINYVPPAPPPWDD